MFSPFTKTPNLESPRDALGTAARDAISDIEGIKQAADTLVEAIPFIREMMDLPLSQAARDVAARAIVEWVAAQRRARFAETFEESTRGFRTLRDQMVATAKRLAN